MTVKRSKKTKTSTLIEPSPPPPSSSARRFLLLGLAGVMLCGLLAGGVGIILFYRTAAPEVAAKPTETATITATIATSPTASPTSMLPVAVATIEPSPTATYAVAPEFINKDKISDITQYVEKVRQLTLPAKLPTQFNTREQLRQDWRAGSFDKDVVDTAEAQDQLYTTLGLIDPEVDIASLASDYQTSNILGYYNPVDKTMHVIADSVNMFAQEETTYAHEYVHALQDHYFNLATYLQKPDTFDKFLAMRSLPEGDARFVEELFTIQNITQDQKDYDVYRYLLNSPPELKGVSPALSILTFFPYSAGEYFVMTLFIKGNYSWQLVNEAYKNPPISTEQVMHPDKYLAGELPKDVTLPNLSAVLGANWHETLNGSFGEVGFLIWLIDGLDSPIAIEGAAGWDGDSYTLWADEQSQSVFTQLSTWESKVEAEQFVKAFSQRMVARDGESIADGQTQFWSDDIGFTFISWQNNQVLIIVAPDVEILDNIRSEFTGF